MKWPKEKAQRDKQWPYNRKLNIEQHEHHKNLELTRVLLGKVWRYQRGNQKPPIQEKKSKTQTMNHKTEISIWATRKPQKTEGELMSS